MKIILFFSRLILSIRYRVKIHWVENLQHDWPILVLPNHIALVDPRIIMSFLWKYKTLSPLASEKYYNLPGLNQVMKMAWTVPIWEMTAWASIEEVKKVFSKIVDWLKEWKNILIYPSGQIYRQNFESIKWKQSTYYIVNNMPANTKVLLLRQRWLWWSMRSKAWDNWKTTFSKAYIKWILYTFANLIFFVPKRNVNIEIFDYTDEINKIKTNNLNEFNQFLEDFYNKEPAEELRFIKHYFYYNDVNNRKEPDIIDWSLKELSKTNIYDLKEIPLEVKNKIIEKVVLIKGIDKSSVSDDSKLVLDLFFDSLDTAEIKSYVQANFPWASNPPITDLKTIADLYVMAVGKSASVEKLKDCDWGRVSSSLSLLSEKIS